MEPFAAEAVELPGSEEQVIKYAAFPRNDLIPLVARADSVGSEKIRASLLRTTETTSSTLGTLEVLPLEILFDIISLLDIRSVFDLRHVNHRAEQIVTKSSGYEVSYKHAIETLHVMLKTKAASWITLPTFAKLLYTKDCQLCGYFGTFLFLPTFDRCCFRCIDMGRLPLLMKISVARLKRLDLKFHAEASPQLKSIVKNLPGHYWDGHHSFTREMRTHIMLSEANANFGLRQGVQTSRVAQARLRHMVTTSFPWLDNQTGHAQTGISCEGCYISKDTKLLLGLPISPPTPWGTKSPVYTEDQFIEHFKTCPLAQHAWNNKLSERMREQKINQERIRREKEQEDEKRRQEEQEQHLNSRIRHLVSEFTTFVNLQLGWQTPNEGI
ncbi:hypothetical protein N7466_004125 [Penicillium verhagenii]|uniref:uncharacterized protein n=1 Tax=Penicillium verhagenii TaxID=1562060 RepID=UPI0025454175|nr:uncharacterized protein N7466_004125 [Penicillium verhagenii]KAJ5934578.1 hypothetical protein N7466_004125 [Penicillium verhagenii]